MTQFASTCSQNGDNMESLLEAASLATNHGDFWRWALACVETRLSARGLGVKRASKGAWHEVVGETKLPADLLAEALDCGRLVIEGGHFAIPVLRPGSSLVLAGESAKIRESDFGQNSASVANELSHCLDLIDQKQRGALQIERLRAILDVSAQWNRTQEMEPLLIAMAEASTRLLEAERASIFLWDKGNKVLVGRPALGVDGGELRIPDTTGVVGHCVHSGEPQRVDADQDEEVSRVVDDQLGFHTRNLLCVPLVGAQGKLFGAFELINKLGGDFTQDDQAALIELASHAAIALENTQEHEQLVKVRDQAADEATQGSRMIGDCAPVEALRSTVHRVANTDLAVLILGENGTGKEVVSKRIHYLSDRRNEPFVAVNCAALTETLLESELFGHEKGAFTDAHATREGKFELASGGTLFLDEIGDMSLSGQAKLLRVLEEKVVVRVGGSLPIHTDARVIAATNQDLASLVREKKFREDLYFRLNVVTLELPPLRDRGEDIILLAEHFLKEFCVKARRKCPKFTAAAKKRLLKHSWPGNVRELRNLMERIAYLSQEEKVDIDELAFILSPSGEETPMFSLELPLNDATKRFQVEYIRQQVERSRGSMTEAAERLGMHRSNLYRKMRQLEMLTDEDE